MQPFVPPNSLLVDFEKTKVVPFQNKLLLSRVRDLC